MDQQHQLKLNSDMDGWIDILSLCSIFEDPKKKKKTVFVMILLVFRN